MEKRERGEHRGGDESLKEKTGDERRLKRKKKTEPRKGGGCGRRGKGSGRTGKKRRAGSGRNVVGKTEWEETK